MISILIITYNRPEDTLALLQSLKGQMELTRYVTEILLLDNNSTVSYAIVERFVAEHPELHIQFIRHKENLGVARGRNFLIAKARGEILLVLDDDVELGAADSIAQVATLFDEPQYKENNTAVITLNIYYHSTKERQKNALPHKHYGLYKDKDWFLTYYFTGAAHVMKKELFAKTGYYPENFFYGMEEYDLSFRIIDAGYSLAYDSFVIVYHKESPLGRLANKQKIAFMWLNKCIVAYKYLPLKYYYSTAVMWLFFYLKNTKFDFAGAVKTFSQIRSISKYEKRTLINKRALHYLSQVKARLWF